MGQSGDSSIGTITTKVPARLDRLPWSRWHWMIVIGLGTVWILDGLEVTVVGNIAEPSVRGRQRAADLDSARSPASPPPSTWPGPASARCSSAGSPTGSAARSSSSSPWRSIWPPPPLTALSFSAWWFFLFRFLTGFGIGGEYAAINSAIDELIPSKYRGRVDLIINGSFWLGAIGGSLLSVVALNTDIFAADVGWRLTFALGVVLGLVILLVRRHVPESPRWLFIHGRDEEAERTRRRRRDGRSRRRRASRCPSPASAITIHQRRSIGFGEIAHARSSTPTPSGPSSASPSSSARRSSTTPSPSASARS